MIDIIIKQNTIGGLFLTDNSILLAPLFENDLMRHTILPGNPRKQGGKEKKGNGR